MEGWSRPNFSAEGPRACLWPLWARLCKLQGLRRSSSCRLMSLRCRYVLVLARSTPSHWFSRTFAPPDSSCSRFHRFSIFLERFTAQFIDISPRQFHSAANIYSLTCEGQIGIPSASTVNPQGVSIPSSIDAEPCASCAWLACAAKGCNLSIPLGAALLCTDVQRSGPVSQNFNEASSNFESSDNAPKICGTRIHCSLERPRLTPHDHLYQ